MAEYIGPYSDAQRYRFIRETELDDKLWREWPETICPEDIDRLVDKHIDTHLEI